MTIDYEARVSALKQTLAPMNLDVIMITSPANVFYYTGFLSDPHERFMALLINNSNDTTALFVPALDKDIAASEAAISNIVSISDEESPYEILKHALNHEVHWFGLEMKAVSMFQHRQLQSRFPNAHYKDIQPVMNQQRTCKSKEEITYLREAVTIIENVLTEGIKRVKIGMTEIELAAELEYLMKQFGAVGPSFSTIVLTGEKAALPHGVPGDRTLQNGDFLLIDFGVLTKHGYCSDITRTFVIGEATEKQKTIYKTVLNANIAGIESVKENVPLKTFDMAARNVIHENGYGHYFNNRVGHGLGIEVHEEPSIHKNNEELAKAGFVFTIEPGIYIPGYGGVRIEDEVYINNAGEAEVLTSFPKVLHIIAP
ncbi:MULTISPECIES: Xaa-Pro peptidase family protein [Clostridia]|uniref:M24 family metallopeptidase n=1 Tax=Clostridia TaxID=186801 RepID=UPI000EA314AF|nr:MULTISPECIES: Xaa-Pro peptidase family protein [Clostridia]NBJ69217.1 aminopeptidase P family protein [Roseburia sp. 1XD42-34]RKI79188.1 aminopeptidase P family protein [Clostridium sp. 1xD42-85]